MGTITVSEKHKNCEQSTLFQIETIVDIGGGPRWSVVMPTVFKKDGKFIRYHPHFADMVQAKSRVTYLDGSFYNDSLTYTDEAMAVQLAKALSAIWDRPLRVMRVQRVRIQRQVGKVILPSGGV